MKNFCLYSKSCHIKPKSGKASNSGEMYVCKVGLEAARLSFGVGNVTRGGVSAISAIGSWLSRVRRRCHALLVIIMSRDSRARVTPLHCPRL